MTALEVVTGRALNPGAALTALTANTNNSFSIRDFDRSSRAVIEGIWTQQATAGEVRLRSPRFHDDVQGIRLQAVASAPRNLLPDEFEQVVQPNDPLRFDISGGGAETDSAAFLVYYRDLAGVAARLFGWEEIKPRVVDVAGHVVQVTGPTTAGDWSAGNAINSFSDALKADTQYAILGYGVGTEVLAVGIAGSDTGNLRLGGPGPLEEVETRDWFVSLSKAHGTPHIPVFNSNNRASTLVSVARNTAGGTINVSLLLARLSQ